MPPELKISNRTARWTFLLAFISLAHLMGGCATGPAPAPAPPAQKPAHPKPYKVYGQWYQPLPDATGFRQRGIASWYGQDFHGKKTSNGEMYNMYAMTAAHKILPLGTYVRVHHLANNQSVDVRINDRGPFVRGRIIDLSYAAAKQIGLVEHGITEVEIRALGTPATTDGGGGRTYVPGNYNSGNFTFQVGAFINLENAQRQKRALQKKYQNAHIAVYDRGDEIFYRVRVGRFTTLEEAIRYEEILIQDGFPDALLVAE